MKVEALDRTLWRTRFGRGYGPVVRQTTEWTHSSTEVHSMIFIVRAVTKSDQKAAVPRSINMQHTFTLGCWNGTVYISGTTQTPQMSTPRWEGPAKI